MARKAPGKSHRKGLTLLEIAEMFRDEDAARVWLVEQRWPSGAQCPRCGTGNVQSDIRHPTMTPRCRRGPGQPMFSVKTGTVREKSKLQCRARAIGIYLFTTRLQGFSSLQLHREGPQPEGRLVLAAPAPSGVRCGHRPVRGTGGG